MLTNVNTYFLFRSDDTLTSTPIKKKAIAKLQRDFDITLELVPVAI